MATKKSINIDYRAVRLRIRPQYEDTLYNEVLPYSLEHWGAIVMLEFWKEITRKITMLYTMPDANPICKHIESTPTTTYRNIILPKYPYKIIYSVKRNDVTILNIIHKSINPTKYKELIKQKRK